MQGIYLAQWPRGSLPFEIAKREALEKLILDKGKDAGRVMTLDYQASAGAECGSCVTVPVTLELSGISMRFVFEISVWGS